MIINLMAAITNKELLLLLMIVIIVFIVLLTALGIIFITVLRKRKPIVKVVMSPNGMEDRPQVAQGQQADRIVEPARSNGPAIPEPTRIVDPEHIVDPAPVAAAAQASEPVHIVEAVVVEPVPVVEPTPVIEEEAVEEPAAEVEEEAVEEPAAEAEEEAVEEPAAEVEEEAVEEPAAEAEEEAVEEPAAEAEEEAVEEPAAEVEEEVVEEPAAEAEEEVVEEPAAEAEEEAVEEPAAEAEEKVVEEPAAEVEEEVVEEEPAVQPEPVSVFIPDLIEDESEEEDEEEATEEVTEEEEEETVVRSVDEKTGLTITVRYRKSFTAKLIQSNDETKAFYTYLKNVLLSYKKVKSRISWGQENFNHGRNNIVRFTMRGKSLCLYFALNPDDYAETKYKVERAESKKYEEIPCMYRIKNGRRAKYAVDLIKAVMEKFGIPYGAEQNENYYKPYETTEQLIEEGLIKKVVKEEPFTEYVVTEEAQPIVEEQPVTVEETIAEVEEEVIEEEPEVQPEPVPVFNPDFAEDESEEEDEEEATEEVTEEEEEETVVRSVDEKTGLTITVRYRKSFTAKLIQSKDETKAFYTYLKNVLLSYKKVKSRISWGQENFNHGRNNVVRFTMRGKSLCLYFALNPDDYAETKYKVERAESKKYEEIPCMYRIKNGRRAKYAVDLIKAVMEKFGILYGAEQNENYYKPYETTEQLIEEGLIKKVVKEETFTEYVVTEEAQPIAVEQPAEEAVAVEEVAAEVAPEAVEEVTEEPAAEVEEEIAEESVEEAEEEVIEEESEPEEFEEVIDPEQAEIIEQSKQEIEQKLRETVTAAEVNSYISDEVTVSLVKKKRTDNVRLKGEKAIVNIDTLSENFRRGERVNLEKLKAKKLVGKNVVSVKVLARGALTKPLTVEAHDFSMEAMKMIIITGGTVIKA